MKGQEAVALLILVLIIVVLPTSVVAYRRGYLPLASREAEATVIDLVARSPEQGGWEPETISVNRGDRVRLRIASTDVVHGFAIGRMGVAVDRIPPGDTVLVEFRPDAAGRYTYYCTVWCSPTHYRMRGILEVIDPENPEGLLETTEGNSAGPAVSGLDIDAPHEARYYPEERPSAQRGERLYAAIWGPHLPDASSVQALYGESPSDVFQRIQRGEWAFAGIRAGQALAPGEIWDVVAYLWSVTSTSEKRAQGEELYKQNCSSCHGETGRGDGPGARHAVKTLPDFTQGKTMAGGSSAIYLAKIRRGGMGTGMPYFGPLFTEEELHSVVDYMWAFLFDYDTNGQMRRVAPPPSADSRSTPP